MTAKSIGTGRATVGEGDTYELPRRWPTQRIRRLVVWCHGAGGTELATATPSLIGQWSVSRAITGAGFPLVTTLLGGQNTWGNSTAQSGVDDAIAWAGSTLGAPTDKVILVGVSMGHILAANWARENPSQVAGVIGLVPGCDLEDMRNTYGAAIEAAWGIGPMDPLPSGANPSFDIPGSSIPWKLYYDSSDAVVLPATVEAFGAAVGASLVQSIGLGHTEAAVAATPTSDLINFLDSL